MSGGIWTVGEWRGWLKWRPLQARPALHPEKRARLEELQAELRREPRNMETTGGFKKVVSPHARA